MTHRERILRIARGEMVDRIPFVPRIDLWHNANELTGTLPEKYRGMSVEDIHRTEGWPLHKIIPEYLKPDKPEDIYHRAMGLYRLKEFPYDFEFSSDVEIEVTEDDNPEEHVTRVAYHTPKGTVTVQHGYTSEMRKAGASITWVKEHAIKGPEDYAVCAHIFGNLKLKPAYERFRKWKESVGEDGVAHAQGLGIACSSPLHFIQKTLLGATEFYLHHSDYRKEMAELSEALENPYNQLIRILADSPCDAVLWSANVDDMITYADLYEKEFMPWIQKAHDAFAPKGILLVQHPDGENRGLMDLIARSGVDVADAVTPFPMTKVTIEEYYDRWCRQANITIHGGIPEMFLLRESSTWDDLKGFIDHLFQAIKPGTRFVASIGDTSPPNTEFERLQYINERFLKEGSLPLQAGDFRPMTSEQLRKAEAMVAPKENEKEEAGRIMSEIFGSAREIGSALRTIADGFDRLASIGDRLGKTPPATAAKKAAPAPEPVRKAAQPAPKVSEPLPKEEVVEDPFALIQQEVLKGDRDRLKKDTQAMLDKGYAAQDILNQGMLSAMEIISRKFTDGTVFIPEVLLSARALNEALAVLEPHLAGEASRTPGKILIGTVRGDLHDIGKNMVLTMLKGVGFNVVDLGVNVKVEDFVKKVAEEKPDILGLSALLTTTMPQIKSVIDALREAGLREKVRVIVGGAPLNRKFADDVGADGYAHDAGGAVALAKELMAGVK